MNFLPVTSVLFYEEDKILFATENEISLYSGKNKLSSERIKSIKVIHGIRAYENILLVYGGCNVDFCIVNDDRYCCRLFIGDEGCVYSAGGTVQNTIVIWRHTDKSSVSLTCLRGHKGAVFDVSMRWKWGLLASVGDDRSVLVWRRQTDETWQLSHNLIGHDARVWGCYWVSASLLVSWGEDCCLATWSVSPSGDAVSSHGPLRRWRVHEGRNVWSGDVQRCGDVVRILTGGNDGAVVVSETSATEKQAGEICVTVLETPLLGSPDFPRTLLMLSPEHTIVVTDCGRLLVNEAGKLVSVSTDIRPELIRSYCCVCYVESLSVIIFGNLRGSIVVAQATVSDDGLCFVSHIHTTELNVKVMLLRAFKPNESGAVIVAACLANGEIVPMSVNVEGAVRISENRVTLSHWATCVELMPLLESCKSESLLSTWEGATLLVGDRIGWVNVFHDSNVASLRLGKVGVTALERVGSSLCAVGTKAGEVLLVAVGKGSLSILTVLLRDPDSLGWVAGLNYDRGLLTVDGFKSVNFRRLSLVISAADTEDEEGLVAVQERPSLTREYACGGGHREWVMTTLEQAAVLTFIQQRAVHRVTWPTSLLKPPLLVKPHWHGKEANACAIICDERSLILVAGSEDCSLSCISLPKHINCQSSEVEPAVSHYHGHISSIRAVVSVPGSDLLLSAGARGQLVVWRQLRSGGGSTLLLLSSVLLPQLLGRVNATTASVDVRVMGIAVLNFAGADCRTVLAATSSGVLLVLLLECTSGRLRLQNQLPVSQCCLSSCVANAETAVVTSTDGCLYWWSLPSLLLPHKVPIHPTSLHGADIHCTRPLVCVGGDDGAVTVATLRPDASVVRATVHPAGSSVQCRWLPGQSQHTELLISLGSDGRLVLCGLDHNEALIPLRVLLSSVGVPDPHCFSVVPQQPHEPHLAWLFVVGMGAKLLTVNVASTSTS